MALTKTWAGRIFGTNTGNVALKLEGDDAALTGTLRLHEPEAGVFVYEVEGKYDAQTLTLEGKPKTDVEGVALGNISASGTLNADGTISGDWESTIGTGGNFVLYPHSSGELSHALEPRQLHTARHIFGAITIDRDEIIEIAEGIRKDFPSVVVTVIAGTEQARFLEDFKDWQPVADVATVLRIHARKPDGAGSDQVVSVEFGPEINLLMTQGADEAWVLGRLDVLRRSLVRFERAHITGFKRWGINFNQFLILAAIVVLPSLAGLRDRVILMAGVLALIGIVYVLHTKYVPLASINLRKRKIGVVQRVGTSVSSWAIKAVAAALAAALAAYLQGYLEPPLAKIAPSESVPATK